MFQSNENIQEDAINRMVNSFIPFITFLFLSASGAALIVSAMIEYNVISEFYKKQISQNYFFWLIPLLIVLALEISKIFLIFFHKQAEVSNEPVYLNNRSQFMMIRVVLIAISFLCTFFFTFYHLYAPGLDNEVEKVKAKLDNQYTLILSKIDQDYQEALDNYQEDIDKWNKIVASETRRLANKSRTRYRSQFKALATYERKLKEAKETLAQMQPVLANTRTQKIAELDKWKQDQIAKAREQIANTPAAHQRLISTTLKIFNENYPPRLYIFTIFVITLLISSSLEFIIWAGPTFAVIRYGIMIDVVSIQEDMEKKRIEKEKAKKKAEDKNQISIGFDKSGGNGKNIEESKTTQQKS